MFFANEMYLRSTVGFQVHVSHFADVKSNTIALIAVSWNNK